ncbi:MAG: ATP-binding protein [Armatimonadota bacterium]|nr:ATP-binding protein [Armatimonadota bacterium]MDW8143679.1 ATP-binding protein [Armatimonadota bacterium]
MRRLLGVVTRGSLTEGLEMKLAEDCSIEDIKAGKFVVIDGDKLRFFSLITDLRLDATTPAVLQNPPDVSDDLVREVLSGTATYATVTLKPMLTTGLNEGGDENPERREPQPVKTVPPHFSPVYEATSADVARIFGSEDMEPKGRYFCIGTPLDMDTPVCIDLHRFVERSNGIFGKTGTGKTFLTRLILSGLIRWVTMGNGRVVTLIFDMHNEYGWKALRETGGTRGEVKGLRQLFGPQVSVFTLDPESSRTRQVPVDGQVVISRDQITVDDIAPLQDELRLHQTAVEAAHLVYTRFGKRWLEELLDYGDRGDIKGLAEQIGANRESLAALYRKLRRVADLPFIVPSDKKPSKDVVETIMRYLQRGIHVVLEFGRQGSMLAYLLVANILARRIHEMYVQMTEEYLATMKPEKEPRQLVIVVEEAHKFLNPWAAKQTIFGTIAREMRKYYVSLLIIDQRPSGIDDEILSQIGTKIVAQLNDERDIQAVLTGVSNPSGLRSILASLDSKQQVLVLGHAVPMPVVVKVRDYDECCTSISYELVNYIPEVHDRLQEEEFERMLYGSDNGADGVGRGSELEERWREIFGEEE